MAYKGGLKKWFGEKWVDVSTGKPCGRKSATKSKRKYPACRPAATAAKMSRGQKAAITSKKRKAGNPGGKPTSVRWPVSPSGRKQSTKRKASKA